MEVAEVWRQFVDELVEYIGVNQRVDLGVAVFYFDAEVFMEGHGEAAVEAAAGHAEVLRGEVRDFAKADAEEVADGGFDRRSIRAVPVDAQDQRLENGRADGGIDIPVLPEPPREGQPQLGDMAAAVDLAQYDGLAAIDRDLLHPVEIVGGELVCFGVAEAGQGQRVAVHGSESGGVALSRRIAGG